MRKIIALFLASLSILSLIACVDQYPDEEILEETITEVETRIVATSNATMHILDRLNIDIIARCETTGEIPEDYIDLPTVGTAMSPDVESLVMLESTDIIGPDTLIETIKPTHDAAKLPYTFIDLQSVEGFYDSIELLAEKYGKQEEAEVLYAERDAILDEFYASIDGKDTPKVMVLMGLPGAYIGCTNNSYVGSLVELAGAENVIKVDTIENFVSWNTEALLELDPDIILLTAHGLPDLAMEMFAKEFSTNDIWKNFTAVANGRVYQLDYDTFGMSATFDWDIALNDLKEILYEGTYENYDAESEYAKSE